MNGFGLGSPTVRFVMSPSLLRLARSHLAISRSGKRSGSYRLPPQQTRRVIRALRRTEARYEFNI